VSYRRQRLRQWLGSFRIQQPDLVNIFWLNLMLSVFFSVMIFYAPIYLNQHIGFDWAEIGVLFTIMLIPFVLFQAPAGAIADKFLGEKEIALTGLFLMIASVMAIPSLGTKNFVAWAVILFTGRSGVALLRSMIDSYFFKKIDIVDIDIINAFRALTPLGYLIGSAGVTLILFFLPFKFIFVALAIVLFFGIRPALKLHDTK
jgi:MFS family permease